MTTMQAVIVDPNTGTLATERVPRPEPRPTEVLAKTTVVGVNPVDLAAPLAS